MNDIVEKVISFLDSLAIKYEMTTHAPVNTIADCKEIDAYLNSITVKNYFLTTRNRKRHFLCLVRPNALFKSGDISKQAGASRLSFGDEASLFELLHVRPGSVSPMGLMFDTENKVELLIDRSLLELNTLSFHPCDNHYTLAISSHDFINTFLPAVKHEYHIVDIHDTINDT